MTETPKEKELVIALVKLLLQYTTLVKPTTKRDKIIIEIFSLNLIAQLFSPGKFYGRLVYLHKL